MMHRVCSTFFFPLYFLSSIHLLPYDIFSMKILICTHLTLRGGVKYSDSFWNGECKLEHLHPRGKDYKNITKTTSVYT